MFVPFRFVEPYLPTEKDEKPSPSGDNMYSVWFQRRPVQQLHHNTTFRIDPPQNTNSMNVTRDADEDVLDQVWFDKHHRKNLEKQEFWRMWIPLE